MTRSRRYLRLLLVTFVVLVSPFLTCHPPSPLVTARASADEVVELTSDSAHSQELSPGATRVYQMQLRSNDYLRVFINRGDLGLKVSLLSAEGPKLAGFVSRRYGPIQVSFIAPTTGSYRLELHSLETGTAGGRYEILIEAVRAATARDRKDEQASTSYAEAESLRTEWSVHSLRAAIEKYKSAAQVWRSVAEDERSAAALEALGELHFVLSEHDLSLSAYKQALNLRRKTSSPNFVNSLNGIAYVYVTLGDNSKALPYCREARALQGTRDGAAATAAELRQQAQTTNNFGEVSYSLGELKQALDSFERALELWTQSGDRSGQALAHLNLGYTHSDSGNLQKASDHFQQALALWRTVHDQRGEALAQTALGAINSFLGERQLALNAYEQTLRIFRAYGDQLGESVALNSIGQVYEDLNELPTALDHYKLALELSRAHGRRATEVVSRYYVARVYRLMGDSEQALLHYNETLGLSRLLGKKRVTAAASNDLGLLYQSLGQPQTALDQYDKVLQFYREVGDRRGQAGTLTKIGDIYYATGEKERAQTCYEDALSYSRAAWDRSAEAEALYRIARTRRDGGQLDQALESITESIAIIEKMRSHVASHQLRASYFASIHKHYEFLLTLLMQLHKLRPAAGYAAAAMQASERARARSLVEILIEARADVRRGVDPNLLDRERSLQRELSAKTVYLMRLHNSAQTAAEAEQIEKELRELTTAYEQVQSSIRLQSPRYSSLMQPHSPSLAEIQNELRGDDTILLEYAMAQEKSYVWAITSESFSSHELPARDQIEQLTREVHRLLTTRPGDPTHGDASQPAGADSVQQYWQKAAELSRALLGPVASQLGNKRLLIVADGALQYLPFEALPAPTTAAGTEEQPSTSDLVPLAMRHEVVYLPSAATLITLRREAPTDRDTASSKSLFVLADPVFDKGDPRVKTFNSSATVAGGSNTRPAQSNDGRTDFPRLPSTRQEAEAIAALIPENSRAVATDFAANRATALNAELERYRIVHIASHSLVNTERPELSGIVLSLVNERGQQEDGFLKLHDIYNLKLGAELVVLSACNTGLGKEVRGEGLIGLTRGFMHAGATSVVASLWKVDDSASAELMTHFYRAMFEDDLPPAAALRSAKEMMWKQKHWRSPYYWSGFVLQGEYRSRDRGWNTLAFALAVALLGIIGVALGYFARRRLLRA